MRFRLFRRLTLQGTVSFGVNGTIGRFSVYAKNKIFQDYVKYLSIFMQNYNEWLTKIKKYARITAERCETAKRYNHRLIKKLY